MTGIGRRSFLQVSAALLAGALAGQVAFGQGAGAAARPVVVFDLDWTILYPVDEARAGVESESVLHIGSERYRLSDHTLAVLQALHLAGFEVSFFSGGPTERNLAVVHEIYRRLNAQAGPGVNFAPGPVGSAADLEPTGAPASAGFTERLKKNLLRWRPELNLARTILVDDDRRFSPADRAGAPSQTANLLWLGETYADVTDYDTWRKEHPTVDRYQPPDRQAWALERNKLAWALGVLLEAKAVAQDSGITLTDAVTRLTRSANGEPLARGHLSQLHLMRQGLLALGIDSSAPDRHRPRPLPPCAVIGATATGLSP